MSDRKLRTWILALCAAAVVGRASVADAGPRNQIGAVTIDSSGGTTTLRVRGSATPTFTVYKLERPTRVVVDLASAELTDALRADEATITYPVGTWAVSQAAAMALEDGSSSVRVVATLARPGRYDVKADGNDVVIKIVARDAAPAQASSTELAAAQAAAAKAKADAERLAQTAESATAQAESAQRDATAARREAEAAKAAAKTEAARAATAVAAAQAAERAAAQAGQGDRVAAARELARAKAEATRAQAAADAAATTAARAQDAARATQAAAEAELARAKTMTDDAAREAARIRATAQGDAQRTRDEAAREIAAARADVERERAAAAATRTALERERAAAATATAEAERVLAQARAEQTRADGVARAAATRAADASTAAKAADTREQAAITAAAAATRERAAAAAAMQTAAEQQRAAASARGDATKARAEADAAMRAAEERVRRADAARTTADAARTQAEAAATAARREATAARAAVEGAATAKAEAEAATAAAVRDRATAEQRAAEMTAKADAAERRAKTAEAAAAAATAAQSTAQQAAADARTKREADERAATEARDRAARTIAEARAAREAEERTATEARDRAARTTADAEAARQAAARTVADAEAARQAAQRTVSDARAAREAEERAAAAARSRTDQTVAAADRAVAAARSQREAEERATADARAARVAEDRATADARTQRAAEERALTEARTARVAEERAAAAAAAARTTAEAQRAAAERAADELKRSLAAEASARATADRAASDRAAAADAQRSSATAAERARADAELRRLTTAADAAKAALAERTREVSTRRDEVSRLDAARVAATDEVARQQAAATAARTAREREEARLTEARAAREAEERSLAQVRADAARVRTTAAATPAPTPAPAPAAATPAPAAKPAARVTAVTFTPDADDHVVTVALAGTGATTELVRADGRKVELAVRGAALPAALTKTLDTSRFGGPIRAVSSYTDRASGDVRVVVELNRDVVPRLDTTAGKVALRFAAALPTVVQRVPSPVVGGFGATSAPVTQTSVAQLGKKKVYRGATIDLDFKDADIHDLLRALARVGNVSIIVPDEIRASVTVQLKRVPWDQALEVILASKGMWYRKEGNLYRIGDRKVLDAEDEAEAARRKAAIELEAPLPEVFTLNYADASALATKLNPLLSPKGKIEVDERTNSLIVNDVKANRKEVVDLAARLDTQTPQITIEARIVEARSSFKREFGIQWGGRAAANSSNGNATGLIFPSSLGFAGGADDTNKSGAGVGVPSEFAVNLPVTPNGALGMTLGSVGDAVNINLRLSAMEDTGTARIISAPKITVLNSVEAKMGQGLRIPISQTSAQGVQTVFVEANLQLTVTPTVSQRDCSVAMNVNVSKNEADFSRVGARGDPTIITREASSRILVADGETSVMGGIYTRSTSVSYSKIPFLGDIPVLGWLFKSRAEADDRSELLIFLTPKIVNRASLRCQQ